MALNIKNAEVEQLIREVASATGVTKTEAIRQAMLLRRESLALPSPDERWHRAKARLEKEVWPFIPPELRGKGLTKEEFDAAVGYGPEGY